MKEILDAILSQIDLPNIIITILGVIGSYVILFVKSKWAELKSKEIDKMNSELLRTLARQAVDYVEMKFKTYTSVDKLNNAIDLITKELNNKGIEVSDIAKFIAIESAVKALKDSGTEVKSNETIGVSVDETSTVIEPEEIIEVSTEPKGIVIKNRSNI